MLEERSGSNYNKKNEDEGHSSSNDDRNDKQKIMSGMEMELRKLKEQYQLNGD